MVRIAGACFGVSVAINCPEPYGPAVQAAFPRGAARIDSSAEVEHNFLVEPHGSAADDRVSVKRGDVLLAPPQPFEAALRMLQKEISWTIAEHTTSYVVIHAGVIAWNNITVVLPGSTHHGKSTLVWSLVQAGATYFSDEYAVFDHHGLVHPFPVPINLRGQNGEVHSVSPLQVAIKPNAPIVLAVARYEPGAVWNPRALTPGEALMTLLIHSINIRSHPKIVLPILRNIAIQTSGFSGVRGEATQLSSWLNCIANNLRCL